MTNAPSSNPGVIDETERRQRLIEIFRKICKPGFSAFGHGTDIHLAPLILEKGLENATKELDQTSIAITYPDRPPEEQKLDLFLTRWPHFDLAAVVVIQIPNPGEGQLGGSSYFNSVFEALPEERRMEESTRSSTRRYFIPPAFIQGYVDRNSMAFVENPQFNPPNRIEEKTYPVGRTRGQIAGVMVPVPEPLSDDSDPDTGFFNPC